MKKKEFKSTTKVYKRTCVEVETYIYYRMLLQRVSRHLSAAEVSFLMGKPLDYVEQMENFKIKSVLAEDLYAMHLVLEMKTIAWMLPLGLSNSREDRYELHIIKMEACVIYQMHKFDVESNQNIIEFKLIDIRHDIDHNENLTESEFELIKELIDKLLLDGYFNEQRTPAEIYGLCCDKLGSYIKPKNLMQVLQPLVEGKESMRLIRKQSGYGFVYVIDFGSEK